MANPRKLQIFISSTYSDLLEERQAAVATVLKAGHIPAGMELFSAGDKSQLDVIKSWIDDSDVYMLILGTRYGSIEPISKLGYTEVEYDYAVATGKPFFALVMSDAAVTNHLKIHGDKFAEKEHPEKLIAFRRKALSKICSLYDDPRDIRANIYESVIDLARREDLVGWVRGDDAIDPKPLYGKISDLSAEVDRLKVDLSAARGNLDAELSPRENAEFSELTRVLLSLKIKIPEDIAVKGLVIDTDVFKLFKLNRNMLVAGVSISRASVKRDIWWEKFVYAPMTTHRLIHLERRSTGIRAYTITERGLDFAAWMDREISRDTIVVPAKED